MKGRALPRNATRIIIIFALVVVVVKYLVVAGRYQVRS
jgi:hypothetical protein